MLKRCYNTRGPRGLTLLEVVGALVLLATLLVGSIMAFGRHAAQIRRGQALLGTSNAVDAMLFQWYRDPATIPRQGTGPLSGVNGVTWQTRVVDSGQSDELGLQVVQLTLGRDDADAEAPALLTLDLIVPAENWPPTLSEAEADNTTETDK